MMDKDGNIQLRDILVQVEAIVNKMINEAYEKGYNEGYKDCKEESNDT